MNKIFPRLFKKYNQNQLPPKERNLIDHWYHDTTHAPASAPNEIKTQREVWSKLLLEIQPQPKVRKLLLWHWAAAAVIFVGIATTLYLVSVDDPKPLDLASVAPAHPQAILVNADNGDAEILLTDKSQLQGIVNNKELDTIELLAPKGASFDITLPDGTIVYLNSDSRIRYPKKFNGTQRQVTLEGEAYFEVAHQKEKPFIVRTDKANITVLGTKFNVRAYASNEDNSISLLEGSVQLHNQFTTTLLKPGEMANIQKDAQVIPITNIGDEDPVAWKNGYFNFNNKPISELCEELARWYNVQFDLTLLKKDIKLHGTISRHQSLLKVLEQLSSTEEIKFETSGQQIIIKNN